MGSLLALLKPLMDFLAKFFAAVFIEANKTPAVEEEVRLEEGDLAGPDPSEYDGLYGVLHRDQGEEDDCDGEPAADT